MLPIWTGSASLRSPSRRGSRGCPAVQRLDERLVLDGPDVGAAGLEQLLLGALGDDPALPDQDQVVGDLLHLVEQVGGEEHGAAACGVLPQQAAHPVDAGRVEAVGRLVEDQDARVAEQRVGDAESLAHAEGVVPEPAPRLGRRQRDQLEHLVDPRPRQAHGLGADREDLAAGAAVVLRRGVEEHADQQTRVRDVAVAVPPDRDAPRAGRREADHDAHRGGLARAVRPEEAGDPARSCHEGHVVDGPVAAVRLGYSVNCDHASSLIAARRRTSAPGIGCTRPKEGVGRDSGICSATSHGS